MSRRRSEEDATERHEGSFQVSWQFSTSRTAAFWKMVLALSAVAIAGRLLLQIVG